MPSSSISQVTLGWARSPPFAQVPWYQPRQTDSRTHTRGGTKQGGRPWVASHDIISMSLSLLACPVRLRGRAGRGEGYLLVPRPEVLCSLVRDYCHTASVGARVQEEIGEGGRRGWLAWGMVSTGLGKLRWCFWWHLPCFCGFFVDVWGWSEVVALCLFEHGALVFGWKGVWEIMWQHWPDHDTQRKRTGMNQGGYLSKMLGLYYVQNHLLHHLAVPVAEGNRQQPTSPKACGWFRKGHP